MIEYVEHMRAIALKLALMTGDPSSHALLQDAPFECMSRTVYAEARGESLEGMALVAKSMMNRHQIQDRRICRIARDAYDGYRLVQKQDTSRFNQQSWQTARLASLSVIVGSIDLGDCSQVTHFLNPKAVSRMPSWASSKNRICSIGSHTAYRIEHI